MRGALDTIINWWKLFYGRLKRVLKFVRMSLSLSFWKAFVGSFKLWVVLFRKGRVMIPKPEFQEKEVKCADIQGYFYITGDVTIEIAKDLESDPAQSKAFISSFRKTVDNVFFLPNVLITVAFEISGITTAIIFWEDIVQKFQ